MAASRRERKGAGSRNVEEQEPERPQRSASRAPSGGGGSAGTKVGLVAALVTAIVVAAAVVPGMGGGDDGAAANAKATVDEAGYAMAGVLAGLDGSFWTGGSSGETKPLVRLKKSVEDLFGEGMLRRLEEAEDELRKPGKDEDAEDRADRGRRLKKFEEALERLEKGGGGSDATSRAKAFLAKVSRNPAAGSQFQYVDAWVREGSPEKPGAFVAGARPENSVTFDLAKREGGSPFSAPGRLGDNDVTVYGQRAQGKADVTVYVAVMNTAPPPAKGGNPLGLAMLVLGPVLVGAVAFALTNAAMGGVRNLARDIERLGSSGDPNRGLRAQGSEANAVARAVERMVANLNFRQEQGGGQMADMDAIVDRERKLASEIHEGLINKHPPRLSDYEVEHLFKPGFEVGGDHFEYFRIDDDHLGVILLDTNVRGVPAAIVMSAARAYVRAAAPGNLSPAAVLRQVNTLLAGELPPGRHVTALYAVVDTAQGKVTLASAGHLPVLVYRQATGKIAKANPGGIAMGLDVGPVFDRELQEEYIALGPGDRLVLYTDGALKIVNEAGEEFGEQRFYVAVAREAPKNSQAFVNFVGSAIDAWHVTTPQNDDVTISTVKRLR